MRKVKNTPVSKYKIFVLDDESGVIESLTVILRRSGYRISGSTDPLEAVRMLQEEHYDMLILDYLMAPIHGDRVVEMIREFDRELYILLLTGYKDLAPPMKTIRTLDIQGYCEKSDRFDQLQLLVESGIKSIVQRQTIRRFRDGLNSILQAVPLIYQLKPISEILEGILAEFVNILQCESAFILADDLSSFARADNRTIYCGAGEFSSEGEGLMKRLDSALLEQIGEARTTRQSVRCEGGVILPLMIVPEGAFGVLYAEGEQAAENIELAEIFANQAAASLNNAFLHSMIHMKNEELDNAYKELKQHYLEVIEALRIVVDAKDGYTLGHSDRVSSLAVRIGEELGFNEHDLEVLRIGSLFHDIGKIGISDNILLKTQALDKAEYEEVKRHPMRGAHILASVSMFREIIPLIKSHHERVDGKGYPEGLTGDEIPLMAKIITVADSFDAMMSDRTYRNRLSLQQTIDELRAGAGDQFDPQITDVCIEILKHYDTIVAE